MVLLLRDSYKTKAAFFLFCSAAGQCSEGKPLKGREILRHISGSGPRMGNCLGGGLQSMMVGIFWPSPILLLEMGHHELCLTWWSCLEVLGHRRVLQLLVRRLGGGGGDWMYHPHLSNKICLLCCFEKPNKTCRELCFIPVLCIHFWHVQLLGRGRCFWVQPWRTESSAGEWRLWESRGVWDV